MAKHFKESGDQDKRLQAILLVTAAMNLIKALIDLIKSLIG